jgi:hypothetical protein
MKKLLATFFSIALSATILGAGNGRETNTFIETYDDGTDVGLWHCSPSVPRILEPSGGNPGAYIQQGGFSSSVPTWASVSTRFQPGVNDTYKIDSIYTGDWTSLGVTSITADLNVIQVATWATDRAVTLELLQMDETGFNVNYDATYTLPDLPDPPVGWQIYSFPVDANSPTIPEGWVFTTSSISSAATRFSRVWRTPSGNLLLERTHGFRKPLFCQRGAAIYRPRPSVTSSTPAAAACLIPRKC